jgi:hypothetical protein
MSKKLLALATIVLPEVQLGDDGKPLTVVVKHKGRDQNVVCHEHMLHEAGSTITVDDKLGAELIAIGAAREFDNVLDDSGDEEI